MNEMENEWSKNEFKELETKFERYERPEKQLGTKNDRKQRYL